MRKLTKEEEELAKRMWYTTDPKEYIELGAKLGTPNISYEDAKAATDWHREIAVSDDD